MLDNEVEASSVNLHCSLFGLFDLFDLQWLKKVSQYCAILKRLENCGVSKRNQARYLQDG